MKTFCFAVILVLGCLSTYAIRVDSGLARKVAINYCIQELDQKVINCAAVFTEFSANGLPEYFVYNLQLKSDQPSQDSSINQGFIIISAEDALEPVIGYSTETIFKTPVLSPEFASWMRHYKKLIEYARYSNLIAAKETQQEWYTYSTGISVPTIHRVIGMVNPLTKTAWDQGAPYNANCPGKCPTGCVATAMAQIMKYWSYPPHGLDTNSYNCAGYGTLRAYFDTSHYNWAAMPLTVNSSNPALAQLMYDCGVSVDMGYTKSSSGSFMIAADYSVCAQNAYVTYFGYNPATIQGLKRINYSDAQWIPMLETELNNGRPLQYAGSGSKGGHSWVCDGYNSSNYFHMNWGWSGDFNGYYNLNSLVPDGIPLDSNEEALIGIEPAPAIACFTGTPILLRAGDTVTFTDNSFGPPASPVTAWEWSFPGAQQLSSSLQNPLIIYNSAGTYNVSETVTTNEGSNTLTLKNYVTVLDNNTVNVYPTLNGGSFTIQLQNGALTSAGINFAIYNMLGEKVFTTTLVQFITRLSLDVPHGMYIFRAFDSSGKPVSTGKLVM